MKELKTFVHKINYIDISRLSPPQNDKIQSLGYFKYSHIHVYVEKATYISYLHIKHFYHVDRRIK